MKVLIVAAYFSPKIGGVESYTKAIAEGLTSRGHSIEVVTTHPDRYGVRTAYIGSIKVTYLPTFVKLSNSPIHPLWFWQLRRIIRSIKPDVINVHAPVPGLADTAILASKSTPLFITYHSGSMLKGTGGLVDRILTTYENTVLPRNFNKAKRIGAVLPSFVRLKTRNVQKIKFTPPGIDTKLFSPPTTKSDRKTDVLFVGRIERSSDWKGIDVLIEACVLLKKNRPELAVRFIGSGDAVDEHAHHAKKSGLDKSIIFGGIKSDNELVNEYRNAKVLVLPSKTESESFGMVLAEAMACGTAVVGSNIGGIPNIIVDNENGYLAEPGNPESLAGKIAQLLDDNKLRERFGKKGRETIVNHFSLAANLDQAEELLQQSMLPKIFHVTAKYPPSLGGLENVVEQLTYAESQLGYDAEVITSTLGHDSQFSDRNKTTRLRAIELARLPMIPGLFFKLLRASRNSIFHIHVAHAFTPEFAVLAAKLKGIKTVAHFHLDVQPSGKFGKIFLAYKKIIFPRMLRSVERVVVFSKDQKKLVVEKYGVNEAKVRIIPNGVSEDYFFDNAKKSQEQVLLFVGRLSKQKNLGQLLYAMQKVPKSMSARIVGSGELEGELKQSAKKLGLDNVIFCGRKDGGELRREYQKASVFTLLSEREGMPLVLLEAMAAGLPVIGNNVVGIREHISSGKNGLLVELNNIPETRLAIEQIFKSKAKLNSMSKMAQDSAKQFSWSKIALSFKELYANIG